MNPGFFDSTTMAASAFALYRTGVEKVATINCPTPTRVFSGVTDTLTRSMFFVGFVAFFCGFTRSAGVGSGAGCDTFGAGATGAVSATAAVGTSSAVATARAGAAIMFFM